MKWGKNTYKVASEFDDKFWFLPQFIVLSAFSVLVDDQWLTGCSSGAVKLALVLSIPTVGASSKRFSYNIVSIFCRSTIRWQFLICIGPRLILFRKFSKKCDFTKYWVPLCRSAKNSVTTQILLYTLQPVLTIRCGHVVRDFESEAKTRCNFQFG